MKERNGEYIGKTAKIISGYKSRYCDLKRGFTGTITKEYDNGLFKISRTYNDGKTEMYYIVGKHEIEILD